MNQQQEMTAYLLAFIKGMKDGGLNHVVISPGSRSTPLALLLHRDPEIKTMVNVDERSAAFFALGMAKALKQPVGVLCTSGTAAANFFPAVCEAKATNVPLLLLTADRPPEARGVGSPQTMDQQKLFGSYIKKFIEMALPEGTPEMLRYSHWHGANCASEAMRVPAGPIQINFPFREPLLPDLAYSLDDSFHTKQAIAQTASKQAPELADWLSKKGLMIVGKELSPDEAKELVSLATYLQWPIIGDPLANLAACQQVSGAYMPHADLIFAGSVPETPEVIWQFGNLPVAKNVMLYLKKYHQTISDYVLIDDEEWRDPLHLGTSFIQRDITGFCKQVFASATSVNFSPENNEWLDKWKKVRENASQVIAEELALEQWSESNASCQLFQLIHSEEALFLSNSNAIRFVDRFASPVAKSFSIYGNRGINGIDGLISTAAGIVAVKNKRIFVLIGDLALFHDMNALELIRRYHLPITLVVLNNNGGGIFSFLPQNKLEEADFEPLFGTPLNLELEKVTSLYNGYYEQPTSPEEFKQAIEESRKHMEWTLIEIKGEQQEPVQLWEKVKRRYQEALD
ncbi:2-succinyl-5-enolpyruvyl-6-hydroxy-3-cyclohexene-1-carboxylic-acid synthase [Candidatus Enterococcus mangumiae]|uniref:2-succinyl-5-enolpyruvyl-6-hydroxy-3-cyclohexene-1-carboxylate synthase n=1 Tax=Candidatus Enterococcus mangumiae TaxID=2230878 RepID=A0ABZ2SZB5_9ENTE|nr:2-succinyl-5-enolpyruvyl-6-hydroxy-3-cyclohexene-1-carboxylic-acid synthase [Enterococcus sp. DIV1094]MBO0489067.1 2-succinyl-5-enolpyruvyl-6-hydroxy-3-cyclohexene-1-carboxylic-acid synthase [Enterococcus sp. DIV1094]